MQHYAIEDWIDLSRGVAAEGLRNAMLEHLRSGCEECASEYATWGAMVEFASAESQLSPPADLIRSLKLAFPSDEPVRSGGRIREMAQLVFDSMYAPQMAGVRGTQMTGRQLLYRAGPIVIDMRLESDDDSGRYSLTGQVIGSEKDAQGMSDLHVHLLRGQSELANTQTNRFGEFHLEYDSVRDLQVALEVSPVKDVYIPLEGALWRPAQED